MSKIKKTWVEKRDCDKEPLVKINPKSWSDMPKGIKMFIPTPKIVDQYVFNIPKGKFNVNLSQLLNSYRFDVAAATGMIAAPDIFAREITPKPQIFPGPGG